VVDRGFAPQSGNSKDYTIGICCFSAKHAVALRRKSKDWLARNQDNMQIIANISTKCVSIFSVMFDVAISHNHRIGLLLVRDSSAVRKTKSLRTLEESRTRLLLVTVTVTVSNDLLALYAITGHCV
jgi:hypothetical protein